MKNIEELPTADSTMIIDEIELPEVIKAELIETVDRIKDILSDNPKFFYKLISKCLLLGKDKGVYISNITSLIYNEYPDLFKHEYGNKLLKSACNLARQLCLEDKTIKEYTDMISYELRDEIKARLDQVIENNYDIRSEELEVNLSGGVDHV